MADDKRIPVWAGIVEVRLPLHFFLHGGRYKDLFFTVRKVHTSPLCFLFCFLLYSMLLKSFLEDDVLINTEII